MHLQAALLAGRTNKALVGREEFSQAVLRSVAGIEKKRSILQGLEKQVVARHEVGVACAAGTCNIRL
jgi:cell division protease FtsH